MKRPRDPWFEHADWLSEIKALKHWNSAAILCYRQRTSYLEDFIFYLVPVPVKKLVDVLKDRWGGAIVLGYRKTPLFTMSLQNELSVSLKIRRAYRLRRDVKYWRDESGKAVIEKRSEERIGKFRDVSVWVDRNFLNSFLADTKQAPNLWFCSHRYSERTLAELGHRKGFKETNNLRADFSRPTESMTREYPRIRAWSELQGRFLLGAKQHYAPTDGDTET